jgi:hypothetical protein
VVAHYSVILAVIFAGGSFLVPGLKAKVQVGSVWSGGLSNRSRSGAKLNA